jgi:hypothetical protein
MGAVQDAVNTWLRDNVVEGNPASGVNDPSKAEGRAVGGLIEQYVADRVSAALSAGGAAKIIIPIGADGDAMGTGTLKTLRLPYGLLLSEVRASGDTAGGSASVFDITVKQTEADSHVSILTDPLQVDTGATTSVGSAAPPSILTHELNDNAEVKIVGTTDGGLKGVTAYLIGSWAAFGVGAIPYFAGLGSAVAGFGGTFNVPYPTGFDLQPDDIAFITVYATTDADGVPTINRPSGWTNVANPVATTAAASMAVFWRRLDGTETGTVTQTITSSGFLHGFSAQMSIWRGCVANGDPYESALGNSGVSAAMSNESIVTLGPNRLAVNLYCHDDAFATDPDTGWVEVFDDGLTAPSFGHQHCASVAQIPIGGATLGETRTFGASRSWASLSLALVPATS